DALPIAAVERTAAVDEHRRAEVAEEIALELDAGGQHVLCAGRVQAFFGIDARADLAPFVAADAAIAAGIEAQAGRHVDQRAGEGIARLAAYDQPADIADALEPGCAM